MGNVGKLKAAHPREAPITHAAPRYQNPKEVIGRPATIAPDTRPRRDGTRALGRDPPACAHLDIARKNSLRPA